ncbi:hypothetical protein NE237_019642 [Protea cynaroides]|uniref:Uncharacterized protein n=1 Tax=Protea cynaroides TaxID=273540 RepID=A0A9Q0K1V7_9MAGN|nr:hypothetical protein NE237_019642 [Protea cynaroides]
MRLVILELFAGTDLRRVIPGWSRLLARDIEKRLHSTLYFLQDHMEIDETGDNEGSSTHVSMPTSQLPINVLAKLEAVAVATAKAAKVAETAKEAAKMEAAKVVEAAKEAAEAAKMATQAVDTAVETKVKVNKLSRIDKAIEEAAAAALEAAKEAAVAAREAAEVAKEAAKGAKAKMVAAMAKVKADAEAEGKRY